VARAEEPGANFASVPFDGHGGIPYGPSETAAHEVGQHLRGTVVDVARGVDLPTELRLGFGAGQDKPWECLLMLPLDRRAHCRVC
jgi:hypothetical protein